MRPVERLEEQPRVVGAIDVYLPLTSVMKRDTFSQRLRRCDQHLAGRIGPKSLEFFIASRPRWQVPDDHRRVMYGQEATQRVDVVTKRRPDEGLRPRCSVLVDDLARS